MVERSGKFLCALLFAAALPTHAGICWSQEPATAAPDAEQEVIIVKYGSLSVKSSGPAARVLIDGADRGSSDDIIESIVTGQHAISCTVGGKTVSGSFTIHKNETLRLEALFDEGKLIPFREPVKVVQQEKKKPDPVKVEKQKKAPEPRKAEPKKTEQKNPVEERRRNHLNVMKLDFDVTNAQELVIEHQENPQTIARFALNKEVAGTYYRTKQGVLLCDAGPCEMTWKTTFVYTDETGKADALLLNWRQIVFNGVTPTGTSKRELECCLNGQCMKKEDTTATDLGQDFDLGRYRVHWTKNDLLLRRTDIMQEIQTAGRSLADY